MVLSEEDVADLLADLERVQWEKEATRADLERAQRERKPLKQKNGNMRRSWRGFGAKGRWACPSTGKVVVIQLIIEELLP